jgi:hypothetical protein
MICLVYRRKSGSASTGESQSLTPHNPFATAFSSTGHSTKDANPTPFSFMLPTSTTNNTSSMTTQATTNKPAMFNGFTGFVPSTSTSNSINTNPIGNNYSSTMSGLTSTGNTNPLCTISSATTATVNTNSDYCRKGKKLNEAFSKWAERQLKDNAIAIWKDGVKDYIKHRQALKQQYPVDAANASSNNSNSSSSGNGNTINVTENTTAVSNKVNSTTFPSSSLLPLTSSTSSTLIPSSTTTTIQQPAAVASISFSGVKSESSSMTTIVTNDVQSAFQFSFAKAGEPSSITSSTSTNAATAPTATATPAIAPPASTSSTFSFLNSFAASSSSSFAAPPQPSSTPANSNSNNNGLFSNSFSFNFKSSSSTGAETTNASTTNTFAAPSSTGLFPAMAAAASNMFSTAFAPTTTSGTGGGGGGEDDDGGGEGGDDEGIPILEPSKVYKNEQDKDIILIEQKTKLFTFRENEWKDTGTGTYRITEDPMTHKKRMVMRNGTGKIMLNAGFYKQLKIQRVKSGLQFAVFVATNEDDSTSKPELRKIFLKLKSDLVVDEIVTLMNKIISEL